MTKDIKLTYFIQCYDAERPIYCQNCAALYTREDEKKAERHGHYVDQDDKYTCVDCARAYHTDDNGEYEYRQTRRVL